MDWITQNKDVFTVILSATSLIVSLCALIWSWINSNKTSKLNRSNILSGIHDKIQPDRQAMEDIFNIWNKGRNKNVSQLSGEESADFIATYNKDFHAKPANTEERKMSNTIHVYLLGVTLRTMVRTSFRSLLTKRTSKSCGPSGRSSRNSKDCILSGSSF